MKLCFIKILCRLSLIGINVFSPSDKEAKFGEIWWIFFLLKEIKTPGYKAFSLLTLALSIRACSGIYSRNANKW